MEDLSSKQRRYFERIFTHLLSKVEPSSSSLIPLPITIAFIRTSGLPDAKLKEAWLLSCNPNEPVSKPQLFNILRYISLGQNNHELKPNLLGLTAQLPLPEFSDLPFSTADFERPDQPHGHLAPTPSPDFWSQPQGGDQGFSLMLKNLGAYKAQIASLLRSPPPFQVSHKNAVEFFSNFAMQHKELSYIWNLCDTNAKGFITEPEIVVAVHLIRLFKTNGLLPQGLSKPYQQFIENYGLQPAQTPPKQPLGQPQRGYNFTAFAQPDSKEVFSSQVFEPGFNANNVFQSNRKIEPPTTTSEFQVPYPKARTSLMTSLVADQKSGLLKSALDEEREGGPFAPKRRGTDQPGSLSDLPKGKITTPKNEVFVNELNSGTLAQNSKLNDAVPKEELGSDVLRILQGALTRLESNNNEQSVSTSEGFYERLSEYQSQRQSCMLKINKNLSDVFKNVNELAAKRETLNALFHKINSLISLAKEMTETPAFFNIPESINSDLSEILDLSSQALFFIRNSNQNPNGQIIQNSQEMNSKAEIFEQLKQNLLPKENQTQENFSSPKKEDKISLADEFKKPSIADEHSRFEPPLGNSKDHYFEPNFDFESLGLPEKMDSKVLNDFISDKEFKNPFADESTQVRKKFDDEFNF